MGCFRVATIVACAGCNSLLGLDPTTQVPPDMLCDDAVCIDRTEVTVSDYAAFLATPPNPSLNHPACAGNDFTPYGTWVPSPNDDHPIVNIDWCDAYAFCSFAHKRLCGDIQGGPLATSNRADVERDQWFHACTDGDPSRLYPYGDGQTYQPGLCNDASAPDQTTHSVTADTGCVGGIPQLLDMSGNVWEFVDSCNSSAPDSDCDIRGGAFSEDDATNPNHTLRCTGFTSLGKTRTTAHQGTIGFRCCDGSPI